MTSIEKTTKNIEHNIQIKINYEIFKENLKKELIKLSKKVHINGFRKGKIPLNIIAQHYEKKVTQEVISDLIKNDIEKIAKKNKLHIIENSLEYKIINKEKDNLIFSTMFETYPEINLIDLKNITIEKPIVEIQEKDIQKILSVIKEKKNFWQDSNQPIAIGDRVTINYKGMLGKKELSDINVSNFILTIDKKKQHSFLEANLIGRKKHELVMIDITFPKDYSISKIREKIVTFSIFIKKVEKFTLPHFTKNFVRNFDIKNLEKDKIYSVIKSYMEKELKKSINDFIMLQINSKVIQKNQFFLPKTLLQEEIKILSYQIKNSQKDIKNIIHFISEDIIRKEAKNYIKKKLFFKKIINVYDIKVDDKKIQKMVQSFINSHEKPNQALRFLQKNNIFIQHIYNMIMEEEIIKNILNNVIIKEKKVTFEKFMN